MSQQQDPDSGWGSASNTATGGNGGRSGGTSGWGTPPSAAGGSGWGTSAAPSAVQQQQGPLPQPIQQPPAQVQGWGPGPPPPQQQQSAPGMVRPQQSAPAQPQPQSSQQAPPSWAAAAAGSSGKGVQAVVMPLQQSQPVQQQAPQPVAPQQSSAVTTPSSSVTTKQLEQLNSMRDSLFSMDGWGGQNVNQDSSWDVPGSPGSSSAATATTPGAPPPDKETPHWKVNNGTDLWEATLRGGPPPSQPVQQPAGGGQGKAPWGHTPTSNHGGTWGEDDAPESDSSSMWNPPPAPAAAPPSAPPTAIIPPNQQWVERPNWSGGSGQGTPVKKEQWSQQPQPQPDWGGYRAGPPPPPIQQQQQPPQWDKNKWDEASPPQQRRQYDDGTSLWSGRQPQQQQQPRRAPWEFDQPAGGPGGGWEEKHGGGPSTGAPGWDWKKPPQQQPGGGWGDDGLAAEGWPKKDLEDNLRTTLHLSDAIDTLDLSRPDPWARPQQPADYPPAAAAGGGYGNYNPNLIQKILQQGPPPQQQQQYRNMPAGGTTSPAQLRLLVQQIQMAVQAGYLSSQILQHPLPQQSLYLLNQLLQQIKLFQQLSHTQQQIGKSNSSAALQLSVQLTKTKQQITNLHNQIAAQQALHAKQQQQLAVAAAAAVAAAQQPPSTGGGGDWSGRSYSERSGYPDQPPQAAAPPQAESRLTQWTKVQEKEEDYIRKGDGWGRPEPWAAEPSSGEEKLDSWPTDLVPEFEPGKPWKGTAVMKSVEDDPTLTPGSVVRSPLSLSLPPPSTAPSQHPKDDYKLDPLSSTTWSYTNTKKWDYSGPPGAPPPGLAAGKKPNYYQSSSNRSHVWLLLRNLTTQIDGSTLKTLCIQHGPLQNFHLYLNHGIALVKYAHLGEAPKAQAALNNCVLGNTTILAETTGEEHVHSLMCLVGDRAAAAAFQQTTSASSTQQQQPPPQPTASANPWGQPRDSPLWSSSTAWPEERPPSTAAALLLPGDLLAGGGGQGDGV